MESAPGRRRSRSTLYRAMLRRARPSVARPSVRPSVRLSVCDFDVSWSHRLEFWATNCETRMFSRCRKVEIDGDDWTRTGKEFQTVEAATGKERRPMVDRL